MSIPDTSTYRDQANLPADPTPRLFNVTECYKMAAAGILRPDESVELLEGRILEKYPAALRLFTADEYENLTRAGILGQDEHLELIEGVILTMSPKSPQHSNAVRRVDSCFRKRIRERALIMTQDTVRLSEHVVVEPDFALLVPPLEKYESRHPAAQDILLILEVAGSSLNFDRHRKAHIYAEAGIVQYLILNTRARVLEEYRDPGPEGYRSNHVYDDKGSFSLVAFPEIALLINELLPPHT
ncbi:MAG TPA: Uma2 family endonuclease [Pyrinomonadaceae bacterium]|nr:Uma2 family endonuclease [Pyrinomonadaceae bacterium]